MVFSEKGGSGSGFGVARAGLLRLPNTGVRSPWDGLWSSDVPQPRGMSLVPRGATNSE